jgi:hypothetical protein
MALKGGQKGNDNAARGARVRQSLERALARLGGTVDKGLDRVADQIVGLAVEGEQWACTMIADRLDGKPHTTIEMAVTDERPTALNAEQLADKLAGALAGRAPVTERTIQ